MLPLALLLLAFCFDQPPDCHGNLEADPLHFEIQTARLTPSAPVPCQVCDEAGNCGPALCPGVPALSPFQLATSFDALAGPSICQDWSPPTPAVGEAILARVVATDMAGNTGACP